MDSLSRRGFLRTSGLLSLASVFPFRLLSNPSKLLPGGHLRLTRRRFSMGSVAELTVHAHSRSQALEAMDEAFGEFDRVERLMSVFNERTQLSRVNRGAWKKEVLVDESIIEVLTFAHDYAKLTGGAFDVTIEPLMELYGFRRDLPESFPSDRAIGEILDAVGMHNVDVDTRRSTVAFQHPRTRLDFGGIAVGYAIDRAVARLRSFDIEAALINHSGDVFALGTPSHDDAWEVGIADPRHPDDVIAALRIKDQALSTSGNYRNFVERRGRRTGHLLDPHTGKPASSILSGTVVASRAMTADALSTGFFVGGIETTKRIIRRTSDLQFIAVVKGEQSEEVIRLRS